jgi:transcriptional regulator with XRE-family HTH domain
MSRQGQRRGESIPDWAVARRQAVGEALRSRRRAFGMSRATLARESGLTVVTIGRIERGESGSDASYGQLAAALGLEPDWFLRTPDTDPEQLGPDEPRPVERALDLLAGSGELGPNVLLAIQRLVALARTGPGAEFHAGRLIHGLPTPTES